MFLREELVINGDLRDRFLAGVGERRATIDRRFEETNPEYYVGFEPVDLTQWFDLVNRCCEQDRYASAAIGYRPLVESLDGNMERVDGVCDHFSDAFRRALNGYVDCVVATERDAHAVADALAFLDKRAASGTTFLAEHFERAGTELRERVDE